MQIEEPPASLRRQADRAVRKLRADTLEVAPGLKQEKLEGWVPELAGEEEIRAALEKAFDYRGDVTMTLKDGSKVQGYIFDRRTGKTLAESAVRIFPKEQTRRYLFLIPRLRRWPSPGATRRQEKGSRPGCGSTGKRRWPARRTSASSRKRWSRFFCNPERSEGALSSRDCYQEQELGHQT